MNKTFLERKSVYHVPGTKCLLWTGIDTRFSATTRVNARVWDTFS